MIKLCHRPKNQVRPTQTVTYDSVQNHWQMKLKFDQIKYFINKLMFEVFPRNCEIERFNQDYIFTVWNKDKLHETFDPESRSIVYIAKTLLAFLFWYKLYELLFTSYALEPHVTDFTWYLLVSVHRSGLQKLKLRPFCKLYTVHLVAMCLSTKNVTALT